MEQDTDPKEIQISPELEEAIKAALDLAHKTGIKRQEERRVPWEIMKMPLHSAV